MLAFEPCTSTWPGMPTEVPSFEPEAFSEGWSEKTSKVRLVSIFLRLEVEFGGNRARGVADPDVEIMACFFAGVFTGVGKARSADEREDWRAEVRGWGGAESKGERREEDA